MISGWAMAGLLLAQTPLAAPGTEVRALTVGFLDARSGEPVDLAISDVALSENGIHREILSFRPDLRPLSVAILVDSSAAAGSDFRLSLLDAVAGAVARLPEGARYSVWLTGERPTRLIDDTDDRALVVPALQRVVPAGGNTVLDALVEVSKDLRQKAREGDRTVVIAVSLNGPELSYRDRFRSAEEAEPNAELFLSVQVDPGSSDFETRVNVTYVLERLAESSGGRNEQVLSPMGTDRALRRLTQVLRAGYRLTYATVPELRKRKLEVTVARPGTRVLLPAGPGATRAAS